MAHPKTTLAWADPACADQLTDYSRTYPGLILKSPLPAATAPPGSHPLGPHRRWEVREGGPVRLWERIEAVLDAYDQAGRPGPETFTLHVDGRGGQHLRHPRMPALALPRP